MGVIGRGMCTLSQEPFAPAGHRRSRLVFCNAHEAALATSSRGRLLLSSWHATPSSAVSPCNLRAAADCALLPRRGPAGRPAAGVHAGEGDASGAPVGRQWAASGAPVGRQPSSGHEPARFCSPHTKPAGFSCVPRAPLWSGCSAVVPGTMAQCPPRSLPRSRPPWLNPVPTLACPAA